MMETRREEPSFDFAISFAGSDRPTAERLATLLSNGGAVVFLDNNYRTELVGRRLDQEFEWIFGPGTKYVVPIISRSYIDRPWPQHEWGIAVREAEKRREEFILPLRLDDSLLFGLSVTVAYIDLRTERIDDVAELLLAKLVGARSSSVEHWVAAFGVTVEQVLSSGDLPTTAPTDYPYLCDWLTDDILARLRRLSINNPELTEDSRNGETFSVRVAFKWRPEDGPLKLGPLAWWEVLEVLPYADVYPDA